MANYPGENFEGRSVATRPMVNVLVLAGERRGSTGPTSTWTRSAPPAEKASGETPPGVPTGRAPAFAERDPVGTAPRNGTL
jgi:hypothetical protein